MGGRRRGQAWRVPPSAAAQPRLPAALTVKRMNCGVLEESPRGEVVDGSMTAAAVAGGGGRRRRRRWSAPTAQALAGLTPSSLPQACVHTGAATAGLQAPSPPRPPPHAAARRRRAAGRPQLTSARHCREQERSPQLRRRPLGAHDGRCNCPRGVGECEMGTQLPLPQTGRARGDWICGSQERGACSDRPAGLVVVTPPRAQRARRGCRRGGCPSPPAGWLAQHPPIAPHCLPTCKLLAALLWPDPQQGPLQQHACKLLYRKLFARARLPAALLCQGALCSVLSQLGPSGA